jgi:hypothetical protein
MKLNKKDKLEYYTFENMQDIRHCFSTRLGGVSEGCYSSLNLGWRNDKRENVVENYRIICDAIGVDYKNTVWTKQVHEDRILNVTEKDRGTGIFTERDPKGYDAVITDRKDVVLTGFSADCVLVFFYDSVKKVVAIAHSGWRGTVKSIAPKTVKKMVTDYGCDVKNIVCGISPAIAKCCFQVDKPVVDEFYKAFDFASEFIENDAKNEGKYYIDLHGVVERDLTNVGIPTENIENSRMCTKCNCDKFFSHRVMGDERGSLAGFISL